jgi:tight adherence protein C
MGGLISFFTADVIFTLLASVATFGTVIALAAPMLEGDKLKSRIKLVSDEKDRLRQAQKMQLEAGRVTLREKPKGGLLQQIVEGLNLRKVFQAETSRIKLRRAGFRSEKHLITFLALRIIVPIVFGIFTFVYTSTVFADRVPNPNMRIVCALIGMLIGFYGPNIMLSNMVKKRQASIKRAWSDALDLLLICVESGMALEGAMIRVSKEIGSQSVALAEELTLTVAELSYLQDRRKAFDNLTKRTGLETVKSVVTTLIQSEKYGTPLGSALRVMAQENRNDRMAEAERKAAALPPKLTIPMILFFLPVIFVVILGPAIITAMGSK